MLFRFLHIFCTILVKQLYLREINIAINLKSRLSQFNIVSSHILTCINFVFETHKV